MKKIIIFSSSFYPACLAGGPVRSLFNLSRLLAKDYNVVVITRNFDVGDKMKKPFFSNDFEIQNIHNIKIYYLAEKFCSIKVYRRILKEEMPDIIYLNSIFDFIFSIKPLFIVKLFKYSLAIIIAPRGELKAEALAYKKLKKKIFLMLAGLVGFYSRALIHITTLSELIGVKQNLKINSDLTFEAPNLPELEEITYFRRPEKLPFTLKIVYIARVSPIKNLIYILESLAAIQDITVSLDIYGTLDDLVYWKKAQSIISGINNHMIDYKGTVNRENIFDILKKYHLYFLPTKSENYGHSIVEALLVGCPVLISKGTTPWDCIEEEKAGRACSLESKQDFIDVIRYFYDIDDIAWSNYSMNAFNFGKIIQNQARTDVIQRYRRIFEIANSGLKKCVE